MVVFLWLFYVRMQMIKLLHYKIYSMRSIFEILPGETG